MNHSHQSKRINFVVPLLILIGMTNAKADIVTLKAKLSNTTGNEVRMNSKTIKLADKQVAKILHFYSFDNTNRTSNLGGLPRVSSAVRLTVTFDELTVRYTHATLFGVVTAGFGQPVSEQGVAVWQIPQFVGPALIQLTIDNDVFPGSKDLGAICTVEVVGNAELVNSQGVKPPTTSAVVKADADGPVEIILESSTDMERTWQVAALGVYGTTDKRRFFRLRAERR